MPNPAPLQDLECTHCGAPIKTTAKPGETVTCDCCGSAFLMPERQTAAIVVGSNVVIGGDEDDKKDSGDAQ